MSAPEELASESESPSFGELIALKAVLACGEAAAKEVIAETITLVERLDAIGKQKTELLRQAERNYEAAYALYQGELENKAKLIHEIASLNVKLREIKEETRCHLCQESSCVCDERGDA